MCEIRAAFYYTSARYSCKGAELIGVAQRYTPGGRHAPLEIPAQGDSSVNSKVHHKSQKISQENKNQLQVKEKNNIGLKNQIKCI